MDGKYIYIVGIIDTLTFFSGTKYIEYLTRRTFQSQGASCVPPAAYAERFVRFMREEVFYPVDADVNRKTWPTMLDVPPVSIGRRTTSTDKKAMK